MVFKTWNHRSHYILNWYFILGLCILIINDHFLKWAYPGIWTGKLSDFAGIYILPMFLAFFCPNLQKAGMLVIFLFFIWWKSNSSDSFIIWYNTFTPIPITRVVDPSDLWALLMLPLSYLTLNRLKARKKTTLPGYFRTFSFLIFTVFALLATSPPKSFYYHHATGNLRCWDCNMKINSSAEAFLDCLIQNGLDISRDSLPDKEPYGRKDYLAKSQAKDHQWPFYIIEKISIDNVTLRQLQIAIEPIGPGKTRLYFNGAIFPQMEDTLKTDIKMLKKYVNLFKDQYRLCLDP